MSTVRAARCAASALQSTASLPMYSKRRERDAGPGALNICTGFTLNVDVELKNILGEILSLGDRANRFTDQTQLLGSLPELDSMAVVSVITTIEERFGVVVDDDEISAQTFATFGSLRAFVEQKVDE